MGHMFRIYVFCVFYAPTNGSPTCYSVYRRRRATCSQMLLTLNTSLQMHQSSSQKRSSRRAGEGSRKSSVLAEESPVPVASTSYREGAEGDGHSRGSTAQSFQGELYFVHDALLAFHGLDCALEKRLAVANRLRCATCQIDHLVQLRL